MSYEQRKPSSNVSTTAKVPKKLNTSTNGGATMKKAIFEPVDAVREV